MEEKKEQKILKVISELWELFYEAFKKYMCKIDHNDNIFLNMGHS